MADDIVLINVPGPGDPSVVKVVGAGDGTVTVPFGADLAALVGRVDAVEASDDAQDTRLAALEAGSGAVTLSYLYTQATPSSVWVIPHGLTFQPAGIDVADHLGNPHYPIVTHSNATTVQLAFSTDVRGTARLS